VAKDNERHSRPGDELEVAGTPEEIARVEAENALRQFDRLRELIREAVEKPPFHLRSWHLLQLNRLAVQGLVAQPGTYRTVSTTIDGSKHTPPTAEEVPRLVDEMCDYVNGHGDKPAIHLAAYVMWRLNWIHPFRDGNGRTTRASSYLVLCARFGDDIPGTRTIPELIAEDKDPYYKALDAADARWKATEKVDVSKMEALLEKALRGQLDSVVAATKSAKRSAAPTKIPAGIRRFTRTAPQAENRQENWWRRLPRWLKAIGGAVLLLIAGGWQLLTNWDNPRVVQVREWLVDRFEGASPKDASPKEDVLAPPIFKDGESRAGSPSSAHQGADQ
jgi:fido (protein-threonine AMPylation protein)